MRFRTASLLLVSASVLAAQDPPLRQGEYIAKTRSGCRLIHTLPATGDTIAYKARWQTFYASADWTGPCQHGLLTGQWTARTASRSTEYFYAYGRQLSKRILERVGGFHHKGTVYAGGDTVVSVPAWDDPWAAKWNAQIGGESWLDGPTRSVITVMASCASYRQSFPDCAAPYDVYGVRFGRRTNVRSSSTALLQLVDDSTSWCPNPRSPVGCEKLWEKISTPVRADIQRFAIKMAERDTQLVRWLATFNAKWVASPASAAPLEPPILTVATAPTPESAPAVPPSQPTSPTAVVPPPVAPAPTPPPSQPVVATGPTTFTPSFTQYGTRVTGLELPGVPSRGACVRLDWITSFRQGVVNLPQTALSDMYRQHNDHRALIATNDCSETIFMTVITCKDDRITEPSTAEFHKYHPDIARWSAGALIGVEATINSYVREAQIPPGISVYIAHTKAKIRRPQDNPNHTFQSKEQLADVLYGAWPMSAMLSDNRETPALATVTRKRNAALVSYSINSTNLGPYPNAGARTGSWPPLVAGLGVHDCAAANLASVWRSTP